MTDLLVPLDQWGDDDEAAISAWLYEDGAHVSQGAVVAEIMVEKTSFDLITPVSGVLRILVDADTPVVKGQAVAQIV